MSDASLLELTAAVEAVARGEAPCHPRTAAILLRRLANGPAPAPPPTLQCGRHLTKREQEIKDLIAAGFGNKEIAEQLKIATNTVKSHVHNMLGKLAALTPPERRQGNRRRRGTSRRSYRFGG